MRSVLKEDCDKIAPSTTNTRKKNQNSVTIFETGQRINHNANNMEYNHRQLGD